MSDSGFALLFFGLTIIIYLSTMWVVQKLDRIIQLLEESKA